MLGRRLGWRASRLRSSVMISACVCLRSSIGSAWKLKWMCVTLLPPPPAPGRAAAPGVHPRPDPRAPPHPFAPLPPADRLLLLSFDRRPPGRVQGGRPPPFPLVGHDPPPAHRVERKNQKNRHRRY